MPLPAGFPVDVLWFVYIGTAITIAAGVWRQVFLPLSQMVQLLRNLDKRLERIENNAVETAKQMKKNTIEIKDMAKENLIAIEKVSDTKNGGT
jgi:hypothetical protein